MPRFGHQNKAEIEVSDEYDLLLLPGGSVVSSSMHGRHRCSRHGDTHARTRRRRQLAMHIYLLGRSVGAILAHCVIITACYLLLLGQADLYTPTLVDRHAYAPYLR
jgi:hypothetical protein